jgi:hypothetical protein
MTAPDISREACERLAGWHELEARALRMHNPNSPAMPEIAEVQDETAALILALRAALDAAERERDEARTDCDGLGHHVAILLQQYLDAMNARDAAAATGYARGVQDAAIKAQTWLDAFGSFEPEHVTPQKWANDAVADIHDAILALLPKKKETNDA